MENSRIQPGVYRHAKSGRLYRVHFTAKHSEDLQEFVVYETLYENAVSRYWVRPVAMFTETVDVQGTRGPRFVYLPDA